jgi:hypothetical protein
MTATRIPSKGLGRGGWTLIATDAQPHRWAVPLPRYVGQGSEALKRAMCLLSNAAFLPCPSADHHLQWLQDFLSAGFDQPAMTAVAGMPDQSTRAWSDEYGQSLLTTSGIDDFLGSAAGVPSSIVGSSDPAYPASISPNFGQSPVSIAGSDGPRAPRRSTSSIKFPLSKATPARSHQHLRRSIRSSVSARP